MLILAVHNGYAPFSPLWQSGILTSERMDHLKKNELHNSAYIVLTYSIWYVIHVTISGRFDVICTRFKAYFVPDTFVYLKYVDVYGISICLGSL